MALHPADSKANSEFYNYGGRPCQPTCPPVSTHQPPIANLTGPTLTFLTLRLGTAPPSTPPWCRPAPALLYLDVATASLHVWPPPSTQCPAPPHNGTTPNLHRPHSTLPHRAPCTPAAALVWPIVGHVAWLRHPLSWPLASPVARTQRHICALT